MIDTSQLAHNKRKIGVAVNLAADKSKDRQRRNNMNRKHLIHQRIKCQGIPVVSEPGNENQLSQINELSKQLNHHLLIPGSKTTMDLQQL